MGKKSKSYLNKLFFKESRNVSGPLLVSRTGEVGCSKCLRLKCPTLR